MIAFIAGAIIFAVNYFMNTIPVMDNLMTAVVLGIAAVPETLPVIVTLSLIYGVENMARKKMPSLEISLPLKHLEMQLLLPLIKQVHSPKIK